MPSPLTRAQKEAPTESTEIPEAPTAKVIAAASR
jgi:hypothetical protein